MIVPPGAGSKIIHPPEDISLVSLVVNLNLRSVSNNMRQVSPNFSVIQEQKRAMLPKYGQPKMLSHSISAPPMLRSNPGSFSNVDTSEHVNTNILNSQPGGNQFRPPSMGLPGKLVLLICYLQCHCQNHLVVQSKVTSILLCPLVFPIIISVHKGSLTAHVEDSSLLLSVL